MANAILSLSFLLLSSIALLRGVQSFIVRGSSSRRLESSPGAWFLRSERSGGANGAVLSAKNLASCDFTLEVMLVQDASSSFEDDLVNLAFSMESFLISLEERFPGSRVGLSAFVDSPMRHTTMQEKCFVSLNPIGSSAEDIMTNLLNYVARGGDDQAEDSIGAMIRAALTAKSGWSALDHQNRTEAGEKPVVRVIIMATDAFAHFDTVFGKDFIYTQELLLHPINKEDEPCCWPNSTFREGVILQRDSLNVDENFNCIASHYATFEDLGDVLRELRIVPVILTGNWQYLAEDGEYYHDPNYDRVADIMGKPNWKDTDHGLLEFWKDVLVLSGVDGFVTVIDDKMSNFVESVLRELEDLKKLMCDASGTLTTTTASESTVVTGEKTHKGAGTATLVESTTTATTTTTTAGAQQNAGRKPSTAAIAGAVGGGAAALAAAAAFFFRKTSLSMYSRNADFGLIEDSGIVVADYMREREVEAGLSADVFL